MKTLYAFLLCLVPMPALAGPFDWTVKNQWSPALEKKFSEFVATMGASNCRTLHDCLTSAAANPLYVERTPKTKKFQSDCADFPVALRMYFAWMEGLPFDYVNVAKQANPAEETNEDIRYTKFGNKPGARKTFQAGVTYNAFDEINNMRNSVSTAMYRMGYTEVSDFYPVKLDLNNIKPGTVVYDPSGHAAIVYKIEKDGRIRMMDAHPDNSVTRITFDQKFTRSRPAHGAGLRNFRPEGNLEPASDLPGFSAEQYNKTFSINGEAVSYYDYIRAMMAGGNLKFNPVSELKSMMVETCRNVHDREIAVAAAISAGIDQKRHPERLPENIYGTTGEWEEYSSPSRDARLKVAFVELRNEIERFVTMYKQGSSRVEYKPVESKYSKNCDGEKSCLLVASLMTAYEEVVMKEPECVFQYKNGDGKVKKLSYTDVVDRLFKLSFDPYHCIELRWGASSKEELASCRSDANAIEWYKAEQGLRNQTERTYDAKMDEDLGGVKGLGKSEAPNVDLWNFLGKLL